MITMAAETGHRPMQQLLVVVVVVVVAVGVILPDKFCGLFVHL